MRLHNAGVQLRLDDAGDVVLLHVGVNMQRHGVWRQAIEQSTGIGLRTLRVLSRDTFRPVRISFTHERPASLEVHRRVLGTAIEFSQECNAIVCRGRDLDMPIPAADPALNREVKRWLDMQLANLRDEPAQRARQIVRMLLPSGLCSVDRVAQHLGMHRRTLNRHLAAEGESVTTIINAVRAELAEEYLANSKRRLYEVAELLGFSSAGDFSRWFRGQFGKTPSDWAAHHRKSKAAARPILAHRRTLHRRPALLARCPNMRRNCPATQMRSRPQYLLLHLPERRMLRAAAQAQIGDINDSNRRNPRRYFTSHAHGTGHRPAIGAPAFDQGGALHARHRRRTQQHQPG